MKKLLILIMLCTQMTNACHLEVYAMPRETEPNIHIESVSENTTVSDNLLPEPETTVSDNLLPEPETTVSDNLLPEPETTISQNTISQNEIRLSYLSDEAYSAFLDLVNQKDVLALIYLADVYAVRKEAREDAEAITSLTSGATVHIMDIEVNETGIWYKIAYWQEDEAKTEGYVNREYLAYSDEDLLAWEAEHLTKMAAQFLDTERDSVLAEIEQFPESYKSQLYALKEKHPNWKFVKFQPKVDWNHAIAEQLKNTRSLVWYSSPDEWKNGEYDKNWYHATKLAIEKFMDPRNSLNETYIFQHEQLTYNASYHSESAVQKILAKTFMAGAIPQDATGYTYAKAFYEIGKRTTVSPFHLASRVCQEQGAGTSPLISGTHSGYEGYYNYFNIGATGSGSQVIINGLNKAKEQGWNTRYKSLDKGADFIGNNYIKVGQDTLYLQKFDIVGTLFTHQYMQNIQAPNTEGLTTKNGYANSGSIDSTFVFKIPIYENMPQSEAGIPLVSISLDKEQAEMNRGETDTLQVSYLPLETTEDKRVTWTSSNPNVVTIEKTDSEDLAKVIAVGSGSATLTAKVGTKTASCTILVRNPVERILLSKDKLVIAPEEKVQIVAEVLPSDAEDKNITWTSLDDRIAEVDANGMVTAKAYGMTRILGKAGGKNTYCIVEVREIEETTTIKLSKKELYLTAGNKAALSITDIANQDKLDQIVWTASTDGNGVDSLSVVKLDNTANFYVVDSKNKRLLTRVGDTIQANAESELKTLYLWADDGTSKASCKVTIRIPVETMEWKDPASSRELTKGDEIQLETIRTPLHADETKFMWSSTNPDVAKVNATEYGTAAVRAEGVGRTIVTASTTEGVVLTKTIIVSAKKKVEELFLSQEMIELTLGETPATIKAFEKLEGGAELTEATDVNWIAANPTIASVDEKTGVVTSVKAGTTDIYAFEQSGSGKYATCRVTVVKPKGYIEQVPDRTYPIDKAYKISPVDSGLKLQAYSNHSDSSVQVQVKDQFGNIVDNNLFAYTSSNPAVALVDGTGRVLPSPSMIAKTAKSTTITATLRNDAAKRKAIFRVTVYPLMQTEHISLTQEIQEDGKWLLTAACHDAQGKVLETTVKWSVSDSTIAGIKANKDGTCTVTKKKAGTFYVNAVANDGYKRSEKILLGEPDITPRVSTPSVTINKQEISDESTKFTLHLGDGVILEEPLRAEDTDLRIIPYQDNVYAIGVSTEWLQSKRDNTSYKLTLQAVIKGEVYQIPLVLKITNQKPNIKSPTITINRQNTDSLTMPAQMSATNGRIVEVVPVANQKNKFDTYISYAKQNGSWNVSFLESNESVDSYKATTLSGKVRITVEGYLPVEKTVTIRTPQTLPTIAGSETPNIDIRYGKKATVSLVDTKTKEKLTGFKIISQQSQHLDATMKGDDIELEVNDSTSHKNGAVLSTKLVIQKPEWAKPVALTLRVKIYHATKPKLVLQTNTLTLNKQLPSETYTTNIKMDRSNLVIKNQKQWKIYRYNATTKKYDILCDENEGIQFSYHRFDGTLEARFLEDNPQITKGSHRYQIRNMINGYDEVSINVAVNVLDAVVSASTKVSGKIDLIRRKDTALQVAITYKNIIGTALSVTSMDSNYYVVSQDKNKFSLKAKEGVALSTAKTNVPVRIVLEGGSVLNTVVSFVPSQSVPKIKAPIQQTLYKNNRLEVREWDITELLPDGVVLHHFEQQGVNADFGVNIVGNTIGIKLQNKGIKPGTYTIKTMVYLKGAKQEFGYPYGKGIVVVFRVKV